MDYYNHKTRITASILASLLASAGILNHGIFEIIQGNKPTNGFFIEAIGEAHRFWIHGIEGAFTLIPNFLITGFIVILVSTAIIVWSVKYLQTKHGANVFLLLMILLTLVGGGLGHIIVFLPVWVYSTRINKSLEWWKRILPDWFRKTLSKLWIYSLVTATLSWLFFMELGIFGYFPGETDSDKILNIVFIFLFVTVVLVNMTFIFAFARDIEERKTSFNE